MELESHATEDQKFGFHTEQSAQCAGDEICVDVRNDERSGWMWFRLGSILSPLLYFQSLNVNTNSTDSVDFNAKGNGQSRQRWSQYR
jgi:hypothetical protein